VTSGSNDCSNAHAATFGSANAVVSWEEISNPTCDFIAMGCRGTFAGTFFQQVDSTGAKVGEAISSEDVYVAGDMVTMSDGRVCWPYVSMTWDLSHAIDDSSSSSTKKISVACLSLGGVDTSSVAATTAAAAATATASVDASSNVASDASSDASASASTEVASIVAPAASSAAVPAASGAASGVSSDASSEVSSDAASEASDASPVVSAAASAAPVVPAASGSADTGFEGAIPSAIPTGIPADESSDEAAFSACTGAPKAHHGNLGHHTHHGHRGHHTSLLPDF
jgi:hypothetical protein